MFLEKHNQTYSEFGIEQSKLWSKGTLVITIAANIAETSILNINAAFPDSIIGFESQNADMIFIKNAIDHLSNKLKSKAETSSQANLNLAKLSELKIVVPSFEEQTSISVFFNKLENLIAQNGRKIDLLKQLKQAYLQKIFSQELRFAGFSDDWEERKLGEIVIWSKGNKLSKSTLNELKKGEDVIHYADLYKFSPVGDDVIHWSESGQGNIIPDNSILFPMSDVTTSGLARTSTITKSGVKAGGDTLIGTLNTQSKSNFISYQINAKNRKILSLVTGTTVKHINSKSLDTLNVFIANIAEQQKIGSFFKQLDNLITLNQQKLNLLKKQKQAYLQKMFI